MKGIRRRIGLWVVLVSMVGCATFQGMEPPRINIANVKAKEIKLFEQIFDLELRIQNPNERDLVVNGLTFSLESNDQPFATGVSNQEITIEHFSSKVIQVEAITSLTGILRQIASAQRSGLARVRYRIKGTLHTRSPGGKLPFDDSGEIEVWLPQEPAHKN